MPIYVFVFFLYHLCHLVTKHFRFVHLLPHCQQLTRGFHETKNQNQMTFVFQETHSLTLLW